MKKLSRITREFRAGIFYANAVVLGFGMLWLLAIISGDPTLFVVGMVWLALSYPFVWLKD